MNCPFCSHENIEGTDACEQCQQPLDDLSLPDPATEIERGLLDDRIQVLHPKPALVVGPDTLVSDVLRLMVDNAIGCAIIVEDDQAIGIFSERDALMRLNTGAAKMGNQPVSEFMTPNPQTLQADSKVAFAVQRMDQGGYRHLPIVDEEGEIIGVISARDILRYFSERLLSETSA